MNPKHTPFEPIKNIIKDIEKTCLQKLTNEKAMQLKQKQKILKAIMKDKN